jgi:hypothetical protein
MPNPIALQPVVQAPRVIPARAELTPEQLEAFQTLLSSSSLLALPEGKTIADLVQFGVAVLPDGKAILQVAIK